MSSQKLLKILLLNKNVLIFCKYKILWRKVKEKLGHVVQIDSCVCLKSNSKSLCEIDFFLTYKWAAMKRQSSNSSFSLTLVCPTFGENLPRALQRTELTSSSPGIGVDDLRSSHGFCRLPPGVLLELAELSGMERGSEPLRFKSKEQSSDNSLIFWKEALFLIEESATTSCVLVLEVLSSSCCSLRSISKVFSRSLSLLLFFSWCESSFPSFLDRGDSEAADIFKLSWKL